MLAKRGTWCHGSLFVSPRPGPQASKNEVVLGDAVGKIDICPVPAPEYEATSRPGTAPHMSYRSEASSVNDRSLGSSVKKGSRSRAERALRGQQEEEVATQIASGHQEKAAKAEKVDKTESRFIRERARPMPHTKVTSKEIGQASYHARLRCNQTLHFRPKAKLIPSDSNPSYTYGDPSPYSEPVHLSINEHKGLPAGDKPSLP